MPSVSISAICNGIASTFKSDVDIVTVQSYDELTESINRADLPLIQVYWEAIQWDTTGNTDRATFGGGVRSKMITIHVDLYAAPRSHLNENMGDLISQIDSIIGVLEEENAQPFFGVYGIKSIDIASIDRVIFEYTSGTSPVWYMGARIVLNLWVF